MKNVLRKDMHNYFYNYMISNKTNFTSSINTTNLYRQSTVRPVLKLNSKGEEVKELQNLLIELNYLKGEPDGYFGKNTERAVLNFQNDNKLLVDGIVGPNTWALLEQMLTSLPPVNEPTIKEGDLNQFVKSMQLRLEILGYFNGEADGMFGSDTTEAVKKFQEDNRLEADGVFGANTWRALNRAFSAVEIPIPVLITTLKEGDTGENVTILQRALKALEFFSGEVTGSFDSNTTEAVILFQERNNLPITGHVDQTTWETIESKILSPGDRDYQEILSEGDTGNEVIILQEKLKELDEYSGSITGSFGPETTTSVKKFQEDYNLPITGVVTKQDWGVLESEIQKKYASSFSEIESIVGQSVLSRPTLRLGSTGDDVKYLQTLLKELMYYNGVIDGVFGNTTNSAVRTFQTNNHLTADGIVGRNTWSALVYLYSPLAACGGTTPAPPPPPTSPKFIGVVIDAGHGGSDPGAVGNEIIEKEYTLKISQYMANRFRELGVPFAMTRTSDESLTNTERVRRMKEPFGDVTTAIVVSNHINAGGGEGAEVIYALRNTPDLARSILTEIGNAGQKTRTYYQRALPSDPTKDYYYIMRDTKNLQTLIVEYGFLDNSNDVLRLQKYWDKFAEGTVKAVTQYMGYPYSEPESGKATYIVKTGDTLWSIATKFNTTVDAIKTLNNLTSNVLTIGQQLFIPGVGITPTPPSGNIVYVVKAGDSLWAIANKFGITVDEIKSLNNLTSNSLSVGQQLFIPGVSIETPETSPTVYTVQMGDTLYSIASKFNTTVDNLRTWNNLTSNTIQPGQRLIVAQVTTGPNITHTVVSGDTLWSIATKFNTTVDAIKSANNLTSNVLTIGQTLIIPTTSTNDFFIHTVVSGDSLWKLANRHNTTVAAIRQLNNLTSDLLSIGQQLKIPR